MLERVSDMMEKDLILRDRLLLMLILIVFCSDLVLIPVTVPSIASVFNEYALKSQYDTSIYLQDLFLYGYGAIYSIFLEFLEPWLSKALKALIFSRTFKSNHAFNYKQCGAGNFILIFLQICRYNLEKVFIYICDNFHGLCICRFVRSYVDDKFYVRNFYWFHFNASVPFTSFGR
ncbi:uncharacterized protein LOC110867935 isoform X2 [Helianthus annuus]|uniref:uncharacterized protein LOC110867935 isoform X2 n=1 Tax=Helianthus annuus TaxID=4232 RepID=UPI00165333BC|nr:uncharacterized protein LOC110867935 isoform X2 [Helianthus annuus]